MREFELSISTVIVGQNVRAVRAEARTRGNHVLHGGYTVSTAVPFTNTTAAEATAEAIAEVTEDMRRFLEPIPATVAGR
jgi:hypothetical protein